MSEVPHDSDDLAQQTAATDDALAETMPNPEPVPDDPFLSGAYRRILRTNLALSAAAAAIAAVVGWRSALGVLAGALVAGVSFAGLHQGAEMLVRRMLPSTRKASKLWILLSFPARYFIVIAATYGILKGYPGMRMGFMVGLVMPVIAMTCEAGYEALFSKSQS